jgi:hypothetical protein
MPLTARHCRWVALLAEVRLDGYPRAAVVGLCDIGRGGLVDAAVAAVGAGSADGGCRALSPAVTASWPFRRAPVSSTRPASPSSTWPDSHPFSADAGYDAGREAPVARIPRRGEPEVPTVRTFSLTVVAGVVTGSPDERVA